ncbi:hypothetical protein V2J09_020797 [Rumex salicifolius]
MGISGGLVRSVFSKRHSFKIYESNVKSYAVDKKRWSSVRSYLCGDEIIMSVLEEEDSLSVKCSEATVTQPLEDEIPEKEEIHSQELKKGSLEEDEAEIPNQESKDIQEAAAIVIQSAFRSFMERNELKTVESMFTTEELLRGRESPSRVSMGTSVEVQAGNSVDVISITEESIPSQKKMQHKPKAQMIKPKGSWDDSQLDSNASKMRAQNRMEAMTRRERALAYAFSQQLRLCSKRKQLKTEGSETVGWSWLERWMATRIPEGSSVEGQLTEQLGAATDTTRPIIRKKFLDLSFEEKESCGSNEVSVQMDKEGKATENISTIRKPISRRKTVPTNHGPRDHMKLQANKKDHSKEGERDIKKKVKQVGSYKKEDSLKAHSTELSSRVRDEPVENSKSDP